MSIFADFDRYLNDELVKAFGMPSSQLAVARPSLTANSLLATMREMERVRVPPPEPRFIFTTSALKEGTERMFPASRHRSARVRKKLIKRHGGEYRYIPCMWKIGNVIYAHPAFERDLKARTIAVPIGEQSA